MSKVKSEEKIVYGRFFEYVMPKGMAEALLNDRIGEEKKMRPKDFLIKYVNEQCGILGECINVVLE